MLSAASALISRLAPNEALSRRDLVAVWLLVVVQVAALLIMVATEAGSVAKIAFLLAWALLNFFWLVVLRRPLAAAFVSLELTVALILLSQFKHDKLWTTADFIDVMIVDHDTSAFLLTVFPSLRAKVLVAALVSTILLPLAWRHDPLRMRARTSAAGGLLCVGALVTLSFSFPTNLGEDFVDRSYVSKFARTGVEAIREVVAHGYLESDPSAPERLKSPATTPATIPATSACDPSRRLPHIILLHDESSFDITMAPGIRVPPGYLRHFQSFDGKARKLVVEGAGGPSWFTEYNVLTGLSAHSFGRFATSVTRIAAGRVARGLPHSLARCGYKTFSLYPFYGEFLSSRTFQMTAGIEHYLDMRDLGTEGLEADSFYFDKAIQIIARERGSGPLFLYVYTVANHFPWDKRLRPELTPNWRELGNAHNVDEYIRRQGMTAHDYRALLEQLKRQFPTESFLIVRYGDHQPEFSRRLIDTSLSEEALAERLQLRDPRYFTTYYAVDAVNFTPVSLASALDTLDAAYLPLVVQEAAGVPLGPTFSAQKEILNRCSGQFYLCAGGAEARRFNRQLIDAGLITGL